MATPLNTTFIPVTFKVLAGGLNSTAGVMNVADEESSDLNNIDFNKFGSILKRNGYISLNSTPCASSGTANGLYWYRGPTSEYAIMVNNGKIYKMDELDGTWDDITGAIVLGTGVDVNTKLLIRCEGVNEATTFTDSSGGKTITNTETYDNYCVLMLHADGIEGSTTISDSSLGTHTAVTISATHLTTIQKSLGTASINFNGSGDYVTIADSDDFNYGSNPFTIDFWVKFNTVKRSYFYIQRTDVNNLMECYYSHGAPGALYFNALSGGTYVGQKGCNWLPVANTWYHLAFVRVSGASDNFRFFINGISQGFAGANVDFGTCPNLTNSVTLGSSRPTDTSFDFDGWMDEFRISKGTARWTSNFTVPATAYGTVGITTSQYKLGVSSGEFKGYERLILADNNDWSFGSGNFTVDFWVRFRDLVNSATFVGQYQDADNYWKLQKVANSSGNQLTMKFVSAAATKGDYIMSSAWPVLSNQWYHLAFERNATNGLVFIDGISQALTTTTSFSTNDVGNIASTMDIGQQNNSSFLDGNLDEFRISKGVVRWTANFTPPSSQFGTYEKQDFETAQNYLIGTDKETIPWKWYDGASSASNLTVTTGLTGARFAKKFQNYLFLANVKVSGVVYTSRVYWSDINTIDSWTDYNYIDISLNDGDEITGLKELGDRLVVYKNNSIHIIIFTGDADIPFIVQKSNSAVGCSAPFSIQANENGHIFAYYEGVYFFDGTNSYKLSDRINETYGGINHSQLTNATSMYQKEKNKYWLSLASGTSLCNNFVLTWDSFLNAWSQYSGISASAMATFLVGNAEERPYFADYNGYAYRADYGMNDSPLTTTTAINSYFYTNWKAYDDLCDKKGVPHVYLAHRNESKTVLTLNYAYDFYNGIQYTQTFSAYTSQNVTNLTTRRDLIGRGRFVRIGIANNATDSPFALHGIGTYVTREGIV